MGCHPTAVCDQHEEQTSFSLVGFCFRVPTKVGFVRVTLCAIGQIAAVDMASLRVKL